MTGFIEFENYAEKVKMMSTPLFLFGMKMYNMYGSIEFYDPDFCNTLSVRSYEFNHHNIAECMEMLNSVLQVKFVTGNLKGLEDFDLRKINVSKKN